MKRYLWALPVITLSLTIFILSSFEMQLLPQYSFEFKDKIIHFIVYGVYGVFTAFAFIPFNFRKRTLVVLIIIWGGLFGASDEIHQYFVPGRFCEFSDWAADILGIIFSTFFINKYKSVYNYFSNK